MRIIDTFHVSTHGHKNVEFKTKDLCVEHEGKLYRVHVSGSFKTKTPAEKFVNCAVFVIALLNTFDYPLLDWHSWPAINPSKLDFLNWLTACVDKSEIPPLRPPLFGFRKKEPGKR